MFYFVKLTVILYVGKHNTLQRLHLHNNPSLSMLDVECPKLGEMDLMGTKVDNAVILSVIAKAPLCFGI